MTAKKKSAKINPHKKREHIPVELWGKDHWSTLMYVETLCVDHSGVPQLERMRCDKDLHPGLCEGSQLRVLSTHPTRLNNGTEVHDHDDWSCVEDAEAAGLLKWCGTGINPVFRLTDDGWRAAHALRRHRADGGKIHDFRL